MAGSIRDNPEIGRVTKSTRQIVEFTVNIDHYDAVELVANSDRETEFVITLNGANIRRYNYWQFSRLMGIESGK